MLKGNYMNKAIEAGCDEAGRGCLAGPVFAAAVIFPADYQNEDLDDSKILKEQTRLKLYKEIVRDAIAYGIASVDNNEIDEINILQASWLAMHKAIDKLGVVPEHLIIDGNKFKPYKEIPFHTIVKGDGKYLSIAAASILAKTARDAYMLKIHEEHTEYKWSKNKGYPTPEHKRAIGVHGITTYHRKSFNMNEQLKIGF